MPATPLCIMRSSDGKLAHLVVPYAISDYPDGQSSIWVYDSNQPLPGTTQILIDPRCEEWQYPHDSIYSGCHRDNPCSIAIVGPELLQRP